MITMKKNIKYYKYGDLAFFNRGYCIGKLFGQVLRYDKNRKEYIFLLFVDCKEPMKGFKWTYAKNEDLRPIKEYSDNKILLNNKNPFYPKSVNILKKDFIKLYDLEEIVNIWFVNKKITNEKYNFMMSALSEFRRWNIKENKIKVKECKFYIGDIVSVFAYTKNNADNGVIVNFNKKRNQYLVVDYLDVGSPNQGYRWFYAYEEDLCVSDNPNTKYYYELSTLAFKRKLKLEKDRYLEIYDYYYFLMYNSFYDKNIENNWYELYSIYTNCDLINRDILLVKLLNKPPINKNNSIFF